MNVLILGNGLSRLSFDAAIRAYSGLIWGCNRVYLDYGDVLDGLAGHGDVMDEAARFRESNGWKFRILGSDEDPLTCEAKYRKDTGTTLVAEALTRGHTVELCGFDLGGLDVYSPGHEKKNKTTWVKRWREIFREFGSGNLSFWGHDHKPFIQSGQPADSYWKAYSKGKSHAGADYEKHARTWANDYSRIYALLPHVVLENIGRRDWKFYEWPESIEAGGSAIIPQSLAEKYATAYPKEFRIAPLQ